MSPPPEASHGHACVEIAHHLRRFLVEHDLAHALGNGAGIITQRDPDAARDAGSAYYSHDGISREPLPSSYPSQAPEPVFEVRSPSDRWPNVLAKVGEYFKAGVLAVAALDPEARKAHVHWSEAPRLRRARMAL